MVIASQLVPESEFTRASDFCPDPGLWHSHDKQATEVEVTELVAAFVRALQPNFVLETGSHEGHTTAAIAAAIRANGHGRFVSIEVNSKLAASAAERAGPGVEILNVSSLEYTPTEPIDFAWLDSGGGLVRYQEFSRFFEWFHSRTIIGIHDTAPHQGDVPGIVEAIIRSGRFEAITLPTPRGVTFGKVRPRG